MLVYRGAVFDLDGVLIDSRSYTCAAVRAACQPHGVFPSDLEIENAYGPAEHTILSKLLGARLADEAYKRLIANYRENVHRLDLHPEIIRLLDDCMRAQIRLGLFTGRCNESIELILDELGLRDFFRVIVTGDGHSDAKPTAQVVRSLLKQLGTAPQQSLLVGDSRADLDAAADTGIDGLLATWFTRSIPAVDPAVPVCSDPGNLWQHIGLKRDH